MMNHCNCSSFCLVLIKIEMGIMKHHGLEDSSISVIHELPCSHTKVEIRRSKLSVVHKCFVSAQQDN